MATYISKIKAYVGSDVDFLNDVVVQDDGTGPRIAQWNLDSPVKPTDEQLNALETEATALDNEITLKELRAVRNTKLAETDWTQSRDVTLTNDDGWATYRQALRDITDTYSDLDSVVWPTKPE
jgi:hypothetical protein